MRCTLLGTGDVTGVPPPFTTKTTANAAARRRRCGVLVETDTTTVLFDVPPEFREGIRQADVHDVDAAFVTHWHHDHVGGIDDLALAARVLDIPLYATQTAQKRFAQEKPYLTDAFFIHDLAHGEPVTIGSLDITPIPVAHARPDADTLAFRLETDTGVLVYAPDFGKWRPDMRGGDEYTNADLAVLEATPAIAPEQLSMDVPTPDPVADAAATRTILIHLNEYVLGRCTAKLETMAAEAGYELGEDFASYTV